ncbi:S1C family serine protease [Orenia marismortui]|uniref:S1C family serine protease n=1 Tax=Orenia marismortui TaxID=46469 RepID=UPI00035CDA5A|nr:trypsin-like peptidase domain-containing protein [Orenia marismortui]
MRRKEKRLIYLALLILGLFIGESLLTHSSVEAFWGFNNQEQGKDKKNLEQKEKTVVLSKEKAVQRVVKKVGSAVVSIVTTDVIERNQRSFFPLPKERKGLGSGFIFDQKGYIITNNHVIEDADQIKVLLSDGRKLKAKLVGRDPRNDLAVIKVEADDLPVALLGDSDKLVPGQMAIAIGSPFDVEFRNTVTTGVVSALNRSIRLNNNAGVLKGLIQTDASINPGNSGGPLLNSQGEVIGINTAIINQAQGIGFSIPINTAKEISKDLIKYGKVKRPWLGIYGIELTKELVDYYDLPVEQGVIIARVILDSPAEEVGLSSNDIIVEANHEKIKGMDDLSRIIKKVGIGNKLELLVMKGDSGELKPLRITLEEFVSKNK